MSWHTREGGRHDLTGADVITVILQLAYDSLRKREDERGHRRSAHPTGQDFDDDLAGLGELPWNSNLLEFPSGFEEGIGGVGRREADEAWHRERGIPCVGEDREFVKKLACCGGFLWLETSCSVSCTDAIGTAGHIPRRQKGVWPHRD